LQVDGSENGHQSRISGCDAKTGQQDPDALMVEAVGVIFFHLSKIAGKA
jgi:hypothetical protein